MKKLIFLGGTVGNNNWREELILNLKQLNSANVDTSQLFNPVVANWNDKAQEAEEEAKKNATHFVFFLANPKQEGIPVSAYSLVEATMALYDHPETTVVVFDETDIKDHSLKAMKQVQKILKNRFPNANILPSRFELLKWLTEELKEEQ